MTFKALIFIVRESNKVELRNLEIVQIQLIALFNLQSCDLFKRVDCCNFIQAKCIKLSFHFVAKKEPRLENLTSRPRVAPCKALSKDPKNNFKKIILFTYHRED